MLVMKSQVGDAVSAEISRFAPLAKRRRVVQSTAPYTVFIRDMKVETLVGAFEHERTKLTELVMDIDIEMASHAGKSDALGDTIDYGAVVADVRRCLATKRYFLLERLSEFVASRILEKFGASRVSVSVAKQGIIEGVGRVGVLIERSAVDAICVRNSAVTGDK
jgi:dihydroneopterin aldolase